MQYQVIDKDGKQYIEAMTGKILIENEYDAVDAVGFCGENNVRNLMLHADNLADCFFDLKSCQAGFILQKFVTYSIKVAVVLPIDFVNQGRFKEMSVEANRGNHFRIFKNKIEAELWLINN